MSHERMKGFTILELLISTAIIVVLSSVVLYNYGTFNDNLAISSSAQEMAIALRQAQIYALNVKESKASSGQYSYAYGVYFNPTSNPGDYYIFVDSNNDKTYTPGNGCGGAITECIERLNLRNGVLVSAICNVVGGVTTCPPGASVRSMSVLFLRPNPDASIYFANNGGTVVLPPPFQTTGKVRLLSLKGKVVDITVENTGQIYVQ